MVWGGGIMAPPLAGATGLPQGRGGRIDVAARPRRSTARRASTPSATSRTSPARTAAPTRSSARSRCRAARAAADNVLADFAGQPRKPFHYHDKGIMAMIGRGAAIAEVGAHRHELHGVIAFSAWLGVHAQLMTGVRNRIDAFIAWGWDYFSSGARAAGARPLGGGADRLGRGRGAGARRVAACRAVTTVGVTTIDLARAQFGLTAIARASASPIDPRAWNW